MNANRMDSIAALRVVAGYLGENEQFGWWPSEFYAATSEMFLSPVFAKTRALTRFTGVSMAAATVHDERIGIGQVYHLFRLPESLEAMLHRTVRTEGFQRMILRHLADRESAMSYLRTQRVASPVADDKAIVGPIRIGDLERLTDAAAWATVASYYHRAFESDEKVYPFFSDGQ